MMIKKTGNSISSSACIELHTVTAMSPTTPTTRCMHLNNVRSIGCSKNICARNIQIYIVQLIIVFMSCISTSTVHCTSIFSLNKRPIPSQVIGSSDADNNLYYIRNLTNNQPFDGDTVSGGVLFLIALIIPFVLQYSIATVYGNKLYDRQYTIYVYIISFVLTGIVTDVIKNYVGYLRPIFYVLCQPNNTYDTCTNSNTNAVTDAHKSFPSGHASTAFCGLTLLTLYLHNRFGIPSIISHTIVGGTSSTSFQQQQSNTTTSSSFVEVNTNDTDENDTVNAYQHQQNQNQQLQHGQRVVKLKLVYTKNPFIYRIYSLVSFIIPMSLAVFIGASRIHDNRHFPADVIAGSIIGASISIFVHTIWWL